MLSAPAPSTDVVSTAQTTAQSTETTEETTTVSTRYGYLGDDYTIGVDVSEHQGYIDWDKVAESDEIDYAIIRAGYGKMSYQKDLRFDDNMKGISKTDLDYGIYWFSYAQSVEDAIAEAETCYEIIKDYDGYNYPIYFDIELASQRDWLTTAQVSAMAEAFCSYLQERGYYAGIYSYSSFLQTKFYKSTLEKYDVWVAETGDKITWYTGDYTMWQYSWTGTVSGISTVVDMNNCYLNYPLIISPETYAESTATTQATLSLSESTTVTAAPVSTENSSAPASSAAATTAAPITTATTTTTAPAPDTYAYEAVGISVSEDNGYIDWNKVKEAGYSFGVIRAGSGGDAPNADQLFYVNMENAKSAGIYCGVYWQAKSATEEGIAKEAEAFYSIIKDYAYEYPIYLDLTDPALSDAGLTKEQYSSLITTFCSYFEDLRYYIGVRADEKFLCDSLDSSVFQAYDVYLINSCDKPVFDFKYGIWQYGSDSVSGILGSTDVAYCYRVYPSVMSFYGLNGFC